MEGLRPLNMRTMAERLEVHETTVSRAVAGKYMETTAGIAGDEVFRLSRGCGRFRGSSVSNEHAKRCWRR